MINLVQDRIDALDEINQCIEIMRLVYLSMHSSSWLEEDFTVVGNVISFTAERIEIARNVLAGVTESNRPRMG